MFIAHQIVLAFHVVAGMLALPAFWVALAARKGGAVHLCAGRFYAVAMQATAGSALLLGALTLADTLGTHPPPPWLAGAELARHAHATRAVVTPISLLGGLALALLRIGLRAARRARSGRPWVVAHLGGLGGAAVVGHGAFAVSILPRLLPAVGSGDPLENPLLWIAPPLAGFGLLALGCLYWRKRLLGGTRLGVR